MKILLTGSSGRIGRANHARLSREHEVVGLDVVPSASTRIVAPLSDARALRAALRGVEAVVHTAALHAPHVGRQPDEAFVAVNVHATIDLAHLALEAGIERFVFTSTTALYGASPTGEGSALWVTEETPPQPRTIYHATKIAAENALEELAGRSGLAVTSLRMSRCFPEPQPVMAAHRLHRGVDERDVADAHMAALAWRGPGYRRYVISARTPFRREDAAELMRDAPAVISRRAPEVAAALAARGWDLPKTIDRVYDSSLAMDELGWQPRFGALELLA